MRPALMCFLVFLVCGCASASNQRLSNYLNANLGRLTYDEAIMKWGRPTSMTQGDKVFVATWSKTSQRMTTTTTPFFGTLYTDTDTETTGWELVLSFDKATMRMVYWKYQKF